jgi:hypothetical protein
VEKARTVPKNTRPTCARDAFSAADSSGVFSGLIAGISELKKSSIQRYLSLTDVAGDTIVFRVLLENTDAPTANIDKSKIVEGKCVTVHYVREIVEEDGIELNRFYYATRLDYPE